MTGPYSSEGKDCVDPERGIYLTTFTDQGNRVSMSLWGRDYKIMEALDAGYAMDVAKQKGFLATGSEDPGGTVFAVDIDGNPVMGNVAEEVDAFVRRYTLNSY